MKSSEYNQHFEVNIDYESSEELFTVSCTKIDNFNGIWIILKKLIYEFSY